MGTQTTPPARTAISDTYPNPTNAVARTGFGVLWDYVTGLLGSTGNTDSLLSNSRILDPQALYNVSLVPSVAGNALTMTLKSSDGSTALAAGNPATVAQRNATLATGTCNLRSITANLSLVVSSGSTLGHSSGVADYLYWYLIDNAGTQELAVSATDFGNSGIVSTTAEGGAGAADTGTIMYSTTARSNVPYRKVGRTLDSQATAGTWTALPTASDLAGLLPTIGRIVNSLGADVAMNNAANYFDGPSVAQGTSGTWFASGTVTIFGTHTTDITLKLWDGTTVIASTVVHVSSGIGASASLSGLIANPAGNIRISGRDSAFTSAADSLVFNLSSLNKDSTLTAIRIA